MTNLEQIKSEKERKRLINKFTPKTFKEEHKINNVIATYTGTVLGVASVLLAYTYTHKFLLKNIPSFAFNSLILGFVSVLLLVYLEFKQRESLNKYIISIYTSTSKYFSLIVGLGITLLSIYLSYMGSFDFVKTLSNSDSPIYSQPNDIKSILLEQKNTVAKLNLSAENYKSLRPKNVSIYDGKIAKITALKKEYRALIKELKQENKEALKDFQNTTLKQFNDTNHNKGSNLGYISLLLQLIVLSCLAFTNYYDYRNYIDLKIDSNITTVVTPLVDTNISNEDNRSRLIVAGFGTQNKDTNTVFPSDLMENFTNNLKLKSKDISSRINTYSKRVSKYEQEQKIDLLSNNKVKLAYWQYVKQSQLNLNK